MASAEVCLSRGCIGVEDHSFPNYASGEVIKVAFIYVSCTHKSFNQMSTYIVAYANGPFEFVEGSYTSPLSGKVRPLRFYGM